MVLAGPRQSGKSTLAASLMPRNGPRWFDLENPVDLQRLQQPMTALTALSQAQPADARSLGAAGSPTPIVIDEVQLAPGLFPVLR